MASESPVKEGDMLADKYRVEKVLGVGGMGVVVAATHEELKQKVALKFLLPNAMLSDEFVKRFVREARASVKLKGEHVAKVMDVGKLDNGCPYMVMEYLDGHDVGHEIKSAEKPADVETVATYLLHACEALAEAHAMGIIHRDLKPGNLFVTKGLAGRPFVKVLDFGIAKTPDPIKSSGEMSLTKTEMLLGSPLYMSPEQMRSAKDIDARTDIWGLGAIAYEMLTGKVPFEANNLMDLCFKVAQEDCVDILEKRPDLPPKLAQIVMRCLEKDVAKRWENVGELARALEPFAGEREKGAAARVYERLDLAPQSVSLITTSPTASSRSEPEVAPAAWGATQAQPKPEPKPAIPRRAIYAGAGFLAIAAIGFAWGSTRGDDRTPLAPASTTSAMPVQPPPPAVELSTDLKAAPPPTGTPSASASAATPTANPPVTTSAPATSARRPPAPSASAAKAPPSAAPTDNSGFIKVRE